MSPHDTSVHDHDDHDHHHSGGHHHGHSHAHGPARFDRAFLIAIMVNGGFIAVEIVAGLMAGSMALVADAGHNFGDVLGLVLAWVASFLTRYAPTARRTYGLKRSSILASLVNAALLLVAIGAIGVEALQQLAHPVPIATDLVMGVAAIGIVINGATALLFMAGREHDINIRGAFLHMATDALVSLGVVISGLVMQMTGWTLIDPLVSLAIVGFVGYGTWGLLRESLDMALDAVPAGIDRHVVEAHLCGLTGVRGVHDLHIWSISTTETALTAHLVRDNFEENDNLLHKINSELKSIYNISHITVQFEAGDPGLPCPLVPDDIV